MQRAPSLRQLQYFIALAEAASFRRAAARLRISQPTLTSQIAALEERLAVQLFERSRTGSRLTPAGRVLLPDARRVVEEFRGFVDHAESMSRGPAGTYRLGVTPTLGPYLLPYVLPRIHSMYAALKFYVREGAPRRLEDDLLAGEHEPSPATRTPSSSPDAPSEPDRAFPWALAPLAALLEGDGAVVRPRGTRAGRAGCGVAPACRRLGRRA